MTSVGIELGVGHSRGLGRVKVGRQYEQSVGRYLPRLSPLISKVTYLGSKIAAQDSLSELAHILSCAIRTRWFLSPTVGSAQACNASRSPSPLGGC